MKKLLSVIPLVAFLGTSCQQNTPTVKTLPPVVEKKAPTVVSKPKKRTYRPKKTTKPKTTPTSTPTPTPTTPKEKAFDPLTPDPTQVTQIAEIPRFEVPENIQPNVTDGINQAEFIELKW
ncbi:MAG: hypothetical protein ACSHYB_05600 [Roseibacillus sp.]